MLFSVETGVIDIEVNVRKTLYKAILCGFALFAFPSIAQNLEQTVSTVETLQSYPEYGGGDVIFTLKTKGSICKGFWLKKDSPGQQTTFSILLAAFQTNTSVSVYGHPEAHNKWNGSATHFCKLYTVQYLK